MNALDKYIQMNGICPLDTESRNEYRVGLGYFVTGWDAHEDQAADELAELKNHLLESESELSHANYTISKLRAALDEISRDMHQVSLRPCPTCRTISKALGKSFGCSAYLETHPEATR